MYLKFWRTRGSVPVPAEDTLRYGGITPCIEVMTSKNKMIIPEAGIRIRALGKFIIQNDIDQSLDIFLSHYHRDHIQGIPFFLPLYQKGRQVKFCGIPGSEKSIQNLLSNRLAKDYFPKN